MRAPLADLTIIEMAGDIATRYCGKLFAAHGARVIALGARRDDQLGYGGASAAAYAAWLDHALRLIRKLRATNRRKEQKLPLQSHPKCRTFLPKNYKICPRNSPFYLSLGLFPRMMFSKLDNPK